MSCSSRFRLLVISHVLPFPGVSGQQLRVRHMIEAGASQFDIDFLTYAASDRVAEARMQLTDLGCNPIVLPARLQRNGLQRWTNLLKTGLFILSTGLKSSNYSIGKVQLSPVRIQKAINRGDYNIVLYEYFHAVDSVELFSPAGVATVLDTHNVLWKSLERHLPERPFPLGSTRRAHLARYRRREEEAWRRFDAVIAINRSEQQTIQAQLRPSQKLFYAPMGTDLSFWPYCWKPAIPQRVAYYGGLGSPHNEAAALQCCREIMPMVWNTFPDAELWLVGSNPSARLRKLADNPRVKVTGFVDRVRDVLSTMSLVLCPWSGTYGFRSRIVEVMALGVPVIATPDAVDGMELQSGKGIILVDSVSVMTQKALELLSTPQQLEAQSRLARSAMERLYSLENTYGCLMEDLRGWLETREKTDNYAEMEGRKSCD
jgi:glycosyltransferase involved in cell wall biosynthesis